MTLDKMLEWLRMTDVPLTTISKKTNVSRKTLYNWINGGVIRNRSYEKVYNVYKQDIDLFNTDIPMKGNSNMEAQYIIDLQKEKIERLEIELERHRASPFQKSQWDDLSFHIYSAVELTFKGLAVEGRKMTDLQGKNNIEKYMGYNSDEIDDLWRIGEFYEKFNEHPIDTILSKKSADDLMKKHTSLPYIFESLKYMIGSHYIPMPISFICKDKSILHTICYNKVDWKNKRVFSKTEFLLND